MVLSLNAETQRSKKQLQTVYLDFCFVVVFRYSCSHIKQDAPLLNHDPKCINLAVRLVQVSSPYCMLIG